jgi:hypothetical protein
MLATQTMAPAGFGVQQGMLMQWAGRMSHSEPLYTGEIGGRAPPHHAYASGRWS